MTEVSLNPHSTDQHHMVKTGKSLEFVPVPGAGVLGEAEAAETQTVGFKNQVFGGKAAVTATFGRVDMEVK